MRSLWSVLLFLAQASVASAQADLQVTSAASPSSGLWLDDEVLVSTTVRNMGPSTVAKSDVRFTGRIDEGHYFHIVRSESPECDYDALDFNPPRFNYSVTFPPIAAGAAHTCVMRFVVFDVPETGRVRHSGQVFSDVTDPNPANNTVAVDFSFGSSVVATRRTIPASSGMALAVVVMLVVARGLRGVRA